MICENLQIRDGNLYFGGHNTVELAKKYGTPLYVMDAVTIRKNCRKYTLPLKKYFGENSYPLYASKACCFKEMYRIIEKENMGADCVSCGEIMTAKAAGFDMSKVHFHSNSKNDFDIAFAIDNGVGYFVCDNIEEITALDRIAGEKNVKQKIMLRITPGIDTHTYVAIRTGNVDSKFGFPIETGAAFDGTALALNSKNLELTGFQCHVGSQLFESDVFIRSVDIMIEFIAFIKEKLGFEARELDLGGGYGVRYHENDPVFSIEENIAAVAEHFHKKCRSMSVNPPAVLMEPGRSIVADAGITLYTVGNVKRIVGYKNYVAVDGGMGDNPRNALYGSTYSCIVANKADENCDFVCDLVGRFCESGDIVTPNTELTPSVCRGDVVAVLTTGAYNFSMASNYNRIPRPAVLMLDGDREFVAVKAEKIQDMYRLDE